MPVTKVLMMNDLSLEKDDESPSRESPVDDATSKSDAKKDAIDELFDDSKDHVNVVFIGHVGM